MDDARARELLSRERARAEHALASLESGDDESELSVWDQHPADFATELYERERDMGLEELLQRILAAIERAERRLGEGTYGRSVESGEPIPDGRLEAIPWAERTAEEQQRYRRRMLGLPG
jgi:DnaK suppressor protein